ncbi:YybH family protein [Solimonas terrae]|uniref:Nuclear transport factor 2 family protein n=1 Tax=Solimonas terrae TaxID=1396819 RepID=A0A6M2BS92_9GAMM|nr:nuclear transport factor 2 family protein [Solimonas terrae]NGY05358.1 nuclear transport factor 2 family protein [Solimonas terrae]
MSGRHGLWAACLLALSAAAAAQAPTDGTTAPPAASAPVPAAETPIEVVPASAAAADAQAVAAIVGAFHADLRDNWRQGVLDLLAPDVAIFEQGFTESSRDAYADGHLDGDLAFAQATKYDVVHRESYASGDTAWVITQARTTGSFADQKVDIDNTETMILKRREGHWQIVHIHWSAHPHDS